MDEKYNTHQWLNPNEFLSYQKPQKEFEIFEEDFRKTMLDYIMFENKINIKEFNEKLLNNILYKSKIIKNKLVLDLEENNEGN